MSKKYKNKYTVKRTDWAGIGLIAAIVTIAPFAWFAAAMFGKVASGY